jgi:transcriptional regulator with XRE-family HTH domain
VENQQQRAGRRRRREEANRLAAECEESGLSQREFCEQRGVPLKTMVRYLARYRREQRGKNQTPQWVAVEVGGAKRRDVTELSIVLAGGRRIEVSRGFDVETLRCVVVALEQA